LVRASEADHLSQVPSAAGTIARLAYARAKAEGIEVEPLLRGVGLTRQQIEDETVRLNVKDQIRFLDLAAGALRDELIGFHLAQTLELRAIGLVYYVLASSSMLAEALERAARYSSIVNEGVGLSFRDGKEIVLRFDYVGVPRRSDRHQIEFWMAALVRICRQLTGRRVPALRVSLTHRRRGDAAELNTFFGADVRFGATVDELVFSPSIREMAVVSADPFLHDLLVKYCEEALASRAAPRSPFGLSVENAIVTLLPHGHARAGDVAQQLGVSQRTLARKLASEGLTFAGVLQSLRSDLAKRHLTDETLPISKIAWLLGYQDVSAFTHAFKRWTGSTPRAARGGAG
jgi:AraC-like DNA-binding protein